MAISIGIPIYNAEKYLADAIKSVLFQTYPYWELILIDDGSSDKSLKIAKEFAEKDNRIRVFSDGLNKRLPARLNQIIDEAKYDYIVRMDADDIIAQDRLEKQINFLLKNPDIDIVSTGILSLRSDLSFVGYRGTPSNKKISLKDAVLGTTGIIHASIMAKKEWFLKNKYNEDNKLAEDYELWLKAFLKNDLRVGFLEDPLYFYREDQNINLKKLLKAYTTQMEIISNISEDFIEDSIKKTYIRQFAFKKIIVRILFMLKMEKILHKRRVSVANSDKYLEVLKINLNNLDSFHI